MLKILIIVSIFGTVSTAGINCPNGKPSSKPSCDNDIRCPSGEMCYRNPNAQKESLCCDQKFCTDTKMKSYSSGNRNGRHLFLLEDANLNGIWHTRKIGSNDATCPIPISALYHIEYEKPETKQKVNALPEDERLPFNNADKKPWKNDGSVILATCSTNKDCEALTEIGYVGYCYPPRNPSYDDPQVDPEVKFCYKLKQLDTKSEFLVDPAKVGPKFCSQHSECADTYRAGASYDPWFCHKAAKTYFNTTAESAAGGLCIRSKTCANGEYAVRTGSNANCDGNVTDTCAGTGLQAANPQNTYHSFCDEVDVGAAKQKLCCYNQVGTCALGKTITPEKNCTKLEDCNPNYDATNTTTHNKWCDAKVKSCCHPNNDNTLVYCPDGATPLHYEPMCTGYDGRQATSGSCEKPLGTDTQKNTTKGMCHHGHCCPETKVINKVAMLGEHTYITRTPCVNGKPPKRYAYAYCDGGSQRVIVIGNKTLTGEALERGKQGCKEDKECGSDEVCVVEMDQQGWCYFDMQKMHKKEEKWGTYEWLCYGGLAAAVLSAILTAVFGVLYWWPWIKSEVNKLRGKKDEDSGGDSSTSSIVQPPHNANYPPRNTKKFDKNGDCPSEAQQYKDIGCEKKPDGTLPVERMNKAQFDEAWRIQEEHADHKKNQSIIA